MARSTKKLKIDLPVLEKPDPSKGAGGWPLKLDHVENWSWRREIFTKDECETIIRIGTHRELQKASTYGPVQSDKNRNSYVNFLFPNELTNWMFGRLAAVINEVNNQYFGFDLQTMEQGLQFTKYTAPAEHYDWHVDRGFMTGTRKLSVSVLLNDPSEYKGGELQFRFGREPDKAPQEQGLGIFFPSYTLHRVTPVTKGTRYSLVAWISGPPFK